MGEEPGILFIIGADLTGEPMSDSMLSQMDRRINLGREKSA
jgi:hypothetical protein